jgi:hypothetical protein
VDAVFKGEASFPPKVRWYDARQRVALKRVALWLNVPWSKVKLPHLFLSRSTTFAPWLLPSHLTPVTNIWKNNVRRTKRGAMSEMPPIFCAGSLQPRTEISVGPEDIFQDLKRRLVRFEALQARVGETLK